MKQRMDGPVAACTTALALAIFGATAAHAAGEGAGTDNPELLQRLATPCAHCRTVPTAEPTDPWLDLDWSIGLRGVATKDDGGQRNEVILAPELSFSHQTLRGGYEFGGNAELAMTPEGDARLGSVELTGEGSYALDAVTTATGNASLTLTQDDPNEPDQPANLRAAPLEMNGQVEAGVTREIGLAEIGLRGGLERSLTGETVYDDGSSDDNSASNNTVVTLGGRLGWRLAPWAAAWLDGEAAFQLYDKASPGLGVRLDNTTYTGRTGITLALRETVAFEASAGLAWRDHADDAIDDFYAMLYAASLSYKPDETVTLEAELSTTVSAPDSGSAGTASIVYAATASATTLINPWLRARASAGASYSEPVGAGDVERAWNAGAGLDWLIDRHTDLNADYRFAQTRASSDPVEDTHTLSLGVTWHR